MDKRCERIAFTVPGSQILRTMLVRSRSGQRCAKRALMLRARRTTTEPASQTVEAKKRKPRAPTESIVPLEECLDHFWDAAENLDDFTVKIETPAVDAVPIKRLGAPGFWRDSKVDFIAVLARAYQGITDGAIRTALGREDK